MRATGVAIYAPPAAGRDEVTAALCAPSGRGLFRAPRAADFRHAAPDELTGGGPRPVVHLSRVRELAELPPARWLKVLLWVPRGVAQQRCAGLADAGQRMAEWERTRLDLAQHPDATWAVALRADTVEATRAAEIIRIAADEERQPEMTTAVLHGFLFK